MGSRRAGKGFKRFLEAVGFILAKFEAKPSHGDPIRDQNYGFGTYDMCWNRYIYGVYISTPDCAGDGLCFVLAFFGGLTIAVLCR